jgi:hypothetical protein
MQIRAAHAEDASGPGTVLRRSIAELCRSDHRDDPAILERWLAHKTPRLVRQHEEDCWDAWHDYFE